MKTIKLEVSCCDEYFDDYNDEVEIEVTQELLDLIRPAKMWLTAYPKYWQVEAFDYRIGEWGVRTDCCTIRISSEHVSWAAMVKHTSIELITQTIDISELEKLGVAG